MTHDRYTVIIYMKIPPFNSLVWGSLRLSPNMNLALSSQITGTIIGCSTGPNSSFSNFQSFNFWVVIFYNHAVNLGSVC